MTRDQQNTDTEVITNTGPPGLAILDIEDCIERLKSTPIGRIAFWSDGGPLVLPVNFKWFDEGVVFRTLEGKKLSAATSERPVCFEVDHWDATRRSGWSVVIRGVAREVTDWAEKEELENVGLVPWTPDEWRHIFVRVDPIEITGRRLKEHG